MKNGVTKEQLRQLQDKKNILQNVCWKPDQLKNGYRKFYPYLPIGYVKSRLIEVLGVENLSFVLQKDQPDYAMGHIEVMFEGGELKTFSAIGVEKEGKNITDKEKKDKVKFKGNVADTIKSCAEWLGLAVPNEIEAKSLKEENKIVYDKKGNAIGNIYSSQEKINAYLNGMSHSRYLLAKVYQINKQKFDGDKELTNQLSNLLKAIDNE